MKRFTTVLALATLAACSRTPAQEAAYQRQVRDEIHLQGFEASRVAASIQTLITRRVGTVCVSRIASGPAALRGRSDKTCGCLSSRAR